MGKLTDTAIRGALAPGKYGDGEGLWLHVSPKGAKRWVFRWKFDQRDNSMALGSYPTVALSKARLEAARRRGELAEGKDPARLREEERQKARLEAARAVTFEQAAKQFIASREGSWKNPKHKQQWPDSFEDYVYPIIGDLPVAAIDNRYVLDVLEQDVPAVAAKDGREVYPAGKFWFARPYTANRVRGRIEAVLDWARFNGYRQGDNPARWRGNLDFALRKVAKAEHHAALPFSEITDFLQSLRERKGAAPCALEFLILTATRTMEVLGATWPEISEDGQTWTIPAARMKAGREHRVPLSGAAQTILARMKATQRGEYIFPAARADVQMSNMSLLSLLRRMGRTDITAHGMRSTFRDWVAEETHFPNHVAEMALAHMIENDAEAAYRRGDLFEKRRALMDAWAAYCNGDTSSKVVQFSGRAA